MSTFVTLVNAAAIGISALSLFFLAVVLWRFRGLDLADIRRVFNYAGQFIDVFGHMRGITNAVFVAGSARIQAGSEAYERLRRITFKLAQRALELTGTPITVITGDGPGAMLAAHQGGHEGGAECVGLGIDLPSESKAGAFPNPYCARRKLIENFFPRKVGLIRWADLGVIIGEQGVGTLDELFEKATIAQCGHDTHVPIYLVEPDAALDLHTLLMGLLRRRTISPSDIRMFTLVDCPNVPFEAVGFVHKVDENRQPLPATKWTTEEVVMRRITEAMMIEEIVGRMAVQNPRPVVRALSPVQA